MTPLPITSRELAIRGDSKHSPIWEGCADHFTLNWGNEVVPPSHQNSGNDDNSPAEELRATGTQ